MLKKMFLKKKFMTNDSAYSRLLLRALLLILGTVLLLDSLYLLIQKKLHIGIVLPLLIGTGFITYAVLWHKIHHWLNQNIRIKRLWKTGWCLFLVWCVSLGWFALKIHENMNHAIDSTPVKAIIVLGSGVENGKPSAALAKRLDAAVPVAKISPHALVILSGGLDFGEQETEAVIMARYLGQHYAIPVSRMALEDQSTSTELNLKNSKRLLAQHHIALTDPVAIVTSDFHTIRAAAIARKQGYTNVTMISAPTPLLIRYNAWLREYFAFLSGWVFNEY